VLGCEALLNMLGLNMLGAYWVRILAHHAFYHLLVFTAEACVFIRIYRSTAGW
jgi:predicted membrane channel-forming protein YqfA (hemolysin III family)